MSNANEWSEGPIIHVNKRQEPELPNLNGVDNSPSKPEHRSFPEAANGLPALPMELELWAAGCDTETARFVARQLNAQGYTLIRAKDIESKED